MFISRKILILTASSLTFALPLQAKITPEDALGIWQKMIADTGYTLKIGAREAQGADLLLKDLDLTLDTPEARGSAKIPEVLLKQVGDKVEYSLPAELSFENTIQMPDSAEPFSLKTTLTQTGFRGEISGTPEAPSFAFAAPLLQVESKAVGGDLTFMPDYTLVFEEIAGTNAFATLAPITFDSAMTAKSLRIEAVSAVGEDPMRSVTTLQDLEGGYKGVLPAGDLAKLSLPELMTSGLQGDGKVKSGAIRSTVETGGGSQPKLATLLLDRSELSYALDATAIRFGFALEGIKPDEDKFEDLASNSSLIGKGELVFDPPLTETNETLSGTGKAEIIYQDMRPLLKRLLAAGQIDGEQLEMARAILEMITMPGDSPEQLKTLIEIDKEGGLSINGFNLGGMLGSEDLE